MDYGTKCPRQLRGTHPAFFRLRDLCVNAIFTPIQLFGASAATKEYVLGIKDYSKATWTQNFIASIAGAVASITVAAPLDTVKTRIQNQNFETKLSGVTVVKDLIKNEGPMALFKGLTPKVRWVYHT
jgi:1,2-phenylacetyl-CoA epoxidase catalytic subunit